MLFRRIPECETGMLGFRDSPERKPHPNDSQTLGRPFQSGTSSFEFGTRDTRAIISEGPAPEQAAISCINSTNSCNFWLLVDFLHHPTFPPRRKLRGFFCLTRTGRGQLQILSMAQTSSQVVSDSNSGLITNSPCTGFEPPTPWSRIRFRQVEAG